jgi:hypothetical protein
MMKYLLIPALALSLPLSVSAKPDQEKQETGPLECKFANSIYSVGSELTLESGVTLVCVYRVKSFNNHVDHSGARWEPKK